jgi:poly(3-hydroxybutyrate) depolymerase
VFREASYIRGEWVYSNGIFLNRGANSDRLERTDYYSAVKPLNDTLYRAFTYDFFGMDRVARNGDFELPTDLERWPDFTADLAELRLAVRGDDLFVRFLFTSLPRVDSQVATLTFARKGIALPVRLWPRNAGARSPWEVALTVWGTGGSLDTAGSSRILPPGSVRVRGNTVEARVPLRLLPRSPWVLTGGAGLADPLDPTTYWRVPPGPATHVTPGGGSVIGNTYVATGANVWSLLFARDAPWTFDELRQSRLLTSGDVGAARETVDVALLRSGVTRRPSVRVGRLSRFFASRLDRGDGIRRHEIWPVGAPAAPLRSLPPREPFVTYEYTGRLQPYGMYVPSSYASSTHRSPLIVYLHGLTGQPDEPFQSVVGMEQELERRGYLLASPLGRGDLSYRGPGELDVLEVIADVKRHYRVDPDRVYLMGHSMGGAGTHNVGLRNPDLFAALAPAQGVESEELASNLRNVPWMAIASNIDADAGAERARAMYSYLSQRGWDAQLIVYQWKSHEYAAVYDSLPRLFEFFEHRHRTRDPAEVSYTKLPEDREEGLGLRHDGAYWISGMTPAHPGTKATATAVTYGIPHRLLDARRAVRSSQRIDEGGWGGSTEAELFVTRPGFGRWARRSNEARLVVSNVRSISLDLARMRLTTVRPLRLGISTDVPVSLLLIGAHDGYVEIRMGSKRWRVEVRNGRLRVGVPAGRRTMAIAPTP